jgi:hypothetical protein
MASPTDTESPCADMGDRRVDATLIHEDVLKQRRAEYGAQIVSAVGRQLEGAGLRRISCGTTTGSSVSPRRAEVIVPTSPPWGKCRHREFPRDLFPVGAIPGTIPRSCRRECQPDADPVAMG